MPTGNIVEQYLSHTTDQGLLVNSLFKTTNNRSILSKNFLDSGIFEMHVTDSISDKIYEHVRGKNKISLFTFANQLVGIKSTGNWDILPTACQLLINNVAIMESQLVQFELTGILLIQNQEADSLPLSDKMICDCMQVKQSKLEDLIHAGVQDFDTLSIKTGACTVCRCCKPRILGILGKNYWFPAIMKCSKKHNTQVNSYTLTPINARFNPPSPGQYLIIQVEINGQWLQRAYTISRFLAQSNTIEVTIKKEPKGYFTSWLFEKAPAEYQVNITQADGHFILNMNLERPALCFAGGIGITPFISYIRFLYENNYHKKIGIVYSALQDSDFVFKKELDALIEHLPSVSVIYHSTAEKGRMTEKNILATVDHFGHSDIYICGPAGFENTIRSALMSINYDAHQVFSEKFLHAGSPDQ